jgi:hypothetical protein
MLCPTPIPVVLSQNQVRQSERALPNTNVHVVPPPRPAQYAEKPKEKRTKPAVEVYRCLIHGIFRPETQVRLDRGPVNQNIKTIVEPNPTPGPERLFMMLCSHVCKFFFVTTRP